MVRAHHPLLAPSAPPPGHSMPVPPLAAVAHELRTPLHGMLGLVALLDGTTLDAEQRAHVALLGESAATLLRFAEDSLELARLAEDPVSAVRPAPCDVRAVLAAVARAMTPLADARGLTLEVRVAAEVPDAVVSDAGRLRQILVNLVGNAVKVTRAGGVRLVGRVERPDAGWLAVDVIDTGPGMTTAHQARLAGAWAPTPTGGEPPVGTGGSSSAGIGLVLAAELARRLGGRLAVTSVHGVGSTFTVWLPLNIATSAADTGAQERPAQGRPSLELP